MLQARLLRMWNRMLGLSTLIALLLAGCEGLIAAPTPIPSITPFPFLTATIRPTITATATQTNTPRPGETIVIPTPLSTPTTKPTVTATPRPVRGAKTPTITPTEFGVCVAPPTGVFKSVIDADPGLPSAMGCATAPPESDGIPQIWSVGILYQTFERGYMLRLTNVGWYETPVVYALFDDAGYAVYDDMFDPSAPPTEHRTSDPPDGLYLPTGSFGKVWYEVAGIQSKIGYATNVPFDETSGQMQVFEYGEMVYLPPLKTVFVMRRGGANSWASYHAAP